MISSTASPTLNLCVMTAPVPASTFAIAHGTSSAIVARKSSPD